MKCVVLAGGKGTRLKPLTNLLNKHALPVYNFPMITFSLKTAEAAGIEEAIIVSNPHQIGFFMQLLLPDDSWKMKFKFVDQENSVGGIADAISKAEKFINGEPSLVLLADNIFLEPLNLPEEDNNAHIWVKRMDNPQQYGVVTFFPDQDDELYSKVRHVVEKPDKPESAWAQLGAYMYPPDVGEKISKLKPSSRGELEVTDLNNLYAEEGRLYAHIYTGPWVDAGTSPDQLLEASIMVKEWTSKKK